MRYEDKIGSGFARWSSGHYTPGQIQAMRDVKSSYILLSGAYRSGKSEIGARMAIRHAYVFPRAKVGVFRKHLASLKKSTLTTLLELIHPDWVKSWSNTELVLQLKNNSTISFLGCEFSNRLGSIELTYAFIDEAHELDEESTGMIFGRMSGPLVLPTNIDTMPEAYREYAQSTVNIRQAILACNPKSKLHPLYQNFIENPKPGHICYTSNSVANSNLPEIYLVNNLSAYVQSGFSQDWVREQIRAIRVGEAPSDGLHLSSALTTFGQRNLLGLWVALEGAIFGQLDERQHLVTTAPEDWGNPIATWGGVDWGFQNPRLIVIKEYSGERYMAYSYWGEAGKEPNEMVNVMERLTQSCDVISWYVPPDQPGLIKLAKKTLGSGAVKRAKNAVLPGIDLVSRFISQGKLLFKDDGSKGAKLCWGEMANYAWQQDRDGSYLDSPIKADDHFPDALRYVLYTRHHRDGINEKPESPLDMDRITTKVDQILGGLTIRRSLY